MAEAAAPKQKPTLRDRYKTPVEQLSDGEVTLRRWHSSDAESLLAAAEASLPELKAWMPWAANGYGMTDAKAFLTLAADQWHKGESYNYALIVDDQTVGSFGLMNAVLGDVGMGMGYWIATPVTGRGLATKAAALLTQTAFGLGAELVQIWHHVDNAKSRAIPERLGYRYIGGRDDLEISEHGMHGVWQMDRPGLP